MQQASKCPCQYGSPPSGMHVTACFTHKPRRSTPDEASTTVLLLTALKAPRLWYHMPDNDDRGRGKRQRQRQRQRRRRRDGEAACCRRAQRDPSSPPPPRRARARRAQLNASLEVSNVVLLLLPVLRVLNLVSVYIGTWYLIRQVPVIGSYFINSIPLSKFTMPRR
eukprot:SAG31_NODE_1001_length_10455_cov_12.021727_6_plen_166_part_00